MTFEEKIASAFIMVCLFIVAFVVIANAAIDKRVKSQDRTPSSFYDVMDGLGNGK